MKKSSGHPLTKRLRSKGYHLDFKLKSAISGGFECNIFSDGKRVIIITGRRVHLMEQGGNAKMLYKYHYCRLGDRAYLEKFLATEVLIKRPELLIGEYGGMFKKLIEKIKSYEKLDEDSKANRYPSNNCIMAGKVYSLTRYKQLRASPQCPNQQLCRMT